uniref:WHIM1 domain-containing protein n=1 Tax=Aegilops tauschii subsp. strangulata TaxID=200361 RepID=A0A453NFS8_AEGTS
NGNYKPLKYPKHGDTWIRKLSKYITDSTLHAKDFILDCLSHGLSGYKNLSPSHKLDVLNSLCDEALSSEKLRTRIEAREGVARQKIRAATEKEKELKERQNDMAKTMGGEIAGNEEANNIFCQIKEAKEVKQAAMNELEERGCVLRSTPVMVDKGVAYWKLDGYCDNNTNILRQEFDKEATMKNQDKWFMFSEDEQKVVENHVTTRGPSAHGERITGCNDLQIPISCCFNCLMVNGLPQMTVATEQPTFLEDWVIAFEYKSCGIFFLPYGNTARLCSTF